jgi:hypothetical protein
VKLCLFDWVLRDLVGLPNTTGPGHAVKIRVVLKARFAYYTLILVFKDGTRHVNTPNK